MGAVMSIGRAYQEALNQKIYELSQTQRLSLAIDFINNNSQVVLGQAARKLTEDSLESGFLDRCYRGHGLYGVCNPLLGTRHSGQDSQVAKRMVKDRSRKGSSSYGHNGSTRSNKRFLNLALRTPIALQQPSLLACVKR